MSDSRGRDRLDRTRVADRPQPLHGSAMVARLTSVIVTCVE
jgi:hypothetical protein